MNKLTLTCLFFVIIFSCTKKKDDRRSIDCSNYYDIPMPISCSGSICQSDTCKTYFSIWKELFLSKNQMTQEYFDKHITICNTGTFKNTQHDISFYLSYKLTIDWFEVKFDNDFLIWLSPAFTQRYPEVGLPNSTLLTKDQINGQINNPFIISPLPAIASVDHLNYSSRLQAINALSDAAGVSGMCLSSLSVQYQNTVNPPIGHPILTASATLSIKENECVSGIMDLSSDYISTEFNACWISFCFTRGTEISQTNNHLKPIEQINTGDTVLSLNTQTMKIEKDIVRQIDSVKHSDIVHISFSDLTSNDNTSDHPYYVKNKGWCSYKPSLTQQKYNIAAKQLLIGDTCLKLKSNRLIEIQVRDIIEKPGSVMSYNLSRLERNNSYFANGVLVSSEQH
jgi:hypothetical protein